MELKFTENANSTGVDGTSNIRVFIASKTADSKYFSAYFGKSTGSVNNSAVIQMLNENDVFGQNLNIGKPAILADHSLFKYEPSHFSFDAGGLGTNVVSYSFSSLRSVTSPNVLNIGVYRSVNSDIIFSKYDLTIYRLTIKENDVVVRNYVPKYQNGVPGLYDTVNDTFISSKTSIEVIPIS